MVLKLPNLGSDGNSWNNVEIWLSPPEPTINLRITKSDRHYMPPDVMQSKLHNTACETFSPHLFNLNLMKPSELIYSLQST